MKGLHRKGENGKEENEDDCGRISSKVKQKVFAEDEKKEVPKRK